MPDSQKTVAVVDDDPEMRASLAALLAAVGYRAETYDSAETFRDQDPGIGSGAHCIPAKAISGK